METELSVMEAGSDAMKNEVSRLAAERQDLTDRLHAATGTFAQGFEKVSLDEPAGDEQNDEGLKRATGEYLTDC